MPPAWPAKFWYRIAAMPVLTGGRHYSTFCPDVDGALDGRAPKEALARVREVIDINLTDCPAGGLPTRRQPTPGG